MKRGQIGDIDVFVLEVSCLEFEMSRHIQFKIFQI